MIRFNLIDSQCFPLAYSRVPSTDWVAAPRGPQYVGGDIADEGVTLIKQNATSLITGGALENNSRREQGSFRML